MREHRSLWARGSHQAVILAVLIIIIGGATAGSMQTESSQFCGACHSMKPAFEAWKESNHASVSCYECHAGTGIGGWVTSKFDLARMARVEREGGAVTFRFEADDAYCKKCHRNAESIMETEDYRIPHVAHVQVGLDCGFCHGGQVHGYGGTGPAKMSHDYCDMCHGEWFEDYDTCLKCHKWD